MWRGGNLNHPNPQGRPPVPATGTDPTGTHACDQGPVSDGPAHCSVPSCPPNLNPIHPIRRPSVLHLPAASRTVAHLHCTDHAAPNQAVSALLPLDIPWTSLGAAIPLYRFCHVPRSLPVATIKRDAALHCTAQQTTASRDSLITSNSPRRHPSSSAVPNLASRLRPDIADEPDPKPRSRPDSLPTQPAPVARPHPSIHPSINPQRRLLQPSPCRVTETMTS